jgi:nucleoside permease NupC
MFPVIQSALQFSHSPALSETAGVAWRTVIVILCCNSSRAALLKLRCSKNFSSLNKYLARARKATQAGTGFVFGYLGGAALPFAETGAGSSFVPRSCAAAGARDSALSSPFYWRILPWVVRGISRVLEAVMGVGGAVGLSTATLSAWSKPRSSSAACADVARRALYRDGVRYGRHLGHRDGDLREFSGR